jgi:hypothetical protein
MKAKFFVKVVDSGGSDIVWPDVISKSGIETNFISKSGNNII